LSAPLSSANAIYRANLDMGNFHQEVLRVVLLDWKYHCIMKRDTFKGAASECLAHPREILRPAIIHSAFACALVNNHPQAPPVLPKRI
jgi:DNA repair protein RadC